jgi:HPt (histidine-containing phosphotransfer) domain-containing protein
LRSFATTYQKGDADLQAALLAGDARAAAEAAHAVRGACATMGAGTAMALAQALETELNRVGQAPFGPTVLTGAARLNEELARLAGVLGVELSR